MHQGRTLSLRLLFWPASSWPRALKGLQWRTFTGAQGPGREAAVAVCDAVEGEDTDIMQGEDKSCGGENG